jgi:hypothetical protein
MILNNLFLALIMSPNSSPREAEPGYYLELGPARAVEATITCVCNYPNFRISDFQVFTAKAPVLSRQNLTTSFEIAGFGPVTEAQMEKGPLQRGLLYGHFYPKPAVNRIVYTLTYKGTLQTCALKEGTSPTPVAPLDEETRKLCLTTDRELNYDAAGFQAYLRNEGLRQQETESPLANVYRAYRHVKNKFGYGGGPAHTLTNLMSAKSTDCGGISQFLNGICRANAHPARLLCGRNATSGSNGDPNAQAHCVSEVWIDGIGWIPIDATAALGKPDSEDWRYFGRNDGNFIALHVGIDVSITQSKLNGPPVKSTFAVAQVPTVWVGGQGDVNAGASSRGTWQVSFR